MDTEDLSWEEAMAEIFRRYAKSAEDQDPNIESELLLLNKQFRMEVKTWGRSRG